jgi:pimeloyl-ACP methyl ester carboxylesterase
MRNIKDFYEVVNNKKLFCRIINEEYSKDNIPYLLFLHEGLGSVEQWKNFPELLSEKLQMPALVYDRYGHGKSEGLKEKRGSDFLTYQAEVVLPELLDKLKIQNN